MTIHFSKSDKKIYICEVLPTLLRNFLLWGQRMQFWQHCWNFPQSQKEFGYYNRFSNKSSDCPSGHAEGKFENPTDNVLLKVFKTFWLKVSKLLLKSFRSPLFANQFLWAQRMHFRHPCRQFSDWSPINLFKVYFFPIHFQWKSFAA